MTESRDNPFRRRPPKPKEPARDAQKRPDPRGNRKDFKVMDGPKRTFGKAPRRDRGDRDLAGKPGPRGVVRQNERGGGLRRLPKDMADLADGRVDRLRRPPKPGAPLEDERIGFVLAGVRNQDARAVYDARVAALRAANSRGDRAALGRGLCEAQRLTLWRARNVTDFAAFAESVVGIRSAEARELAQDAARAAKITLDALPPQVIALWLRIEAALSRTCPTATVSVNGMGDALEFELHIPGGDVGRTVEGFFDMGGAATGLRRFLRPA